MQLAQYIDHTYLRPDCTEEIVDRLIADAQAYSFKAICIPPMYLSYVAERVELRTFLLCTVAGFPIGYDHSEAKLASLQRSAELGADEVDVVMNLPAIKTGHWQMLRREMRSLVESAAMANVTLKCIIEAQLLTDDEILHICDIGNEVKVPFMKTSTGFFGEPVKEDTVRLMRRHLDPEIRIKASGGISTHAQALRMIRAGADRLGCSQSLAIINAQDA